MGHQVDEDLGPGSEVLTPAAREITVVPWPRSDDDAPVDADEPDEPADAAEPSVPDERSTPGPRANEHRLPSPRRHLL